MTEKIDPVVKILLDRTNQEYAAIEDRQQRFQSLLDTWTQSRESDQSLDFSIQRDTPLVVAIVLECLKQTSQLKEA